jgi:hypothetical protein
MPSGAVVGIDTNLDCIRDVTAVMYGPVSVQRTNPLDDSNNFPGTRPVDGHRDVIDTEILSMNLIGGSASLVAGFGLGTIPLGHSLGNTAELPTDPNRADSFFDVFCEVTVGGNRFYNQTPLRMRNDGVICVSPGSLYARPDGCVPLYTSPIPGQGVHVANLVSASDEPFPGSGACCIGTQCLILVSTNCLGQGGIYHGDNTPCEPYPCQPQAGACCYGDGTCNIKPSTDCQASGGLYLGDGSQCDPNPCPRECNQCGPGPHWVDNCRAGLDAMPSGAVVGIDTNLDCVRDLVMVLYGSLSVQRTDPLDDSNNYPGTRPVDGHRDVIDTEILSMNLTGGGATLVAGFGLGTIPLGHSRGTTAERPTDQNLADSFFDVFFEVTVSGNHLYNQTPLRMRNDGILCAPPGSLYAHPDGCIPLYTSPVPGQGVLVANLVSASEEPFPGQGACCLDTRCSILVSSDCLGEGGIYQGDGSVCTPDPCVSGVAVEGAPSGSARLLGIVPNPVVGSTTIRFYAPVVGRVELAIYDAAGGLVRTLTSESAVSGQRSVVWDCRDQQGRRVAAGSYQYVIRAGASKLAGKMTVVR